jgi:hypothetical protein
MGIKYLWDTNTAIYYLQQQFPPGAEQFIDDLLKDEQPVISAITEIELLCWKTATEKDLEVLHSFINDALVIELEQPIKLLNKKSILKFELTKFTFCIAITWSFYYFNLCFIPCFMNF